jgi:hypothetical protein
MATTKRQRQAKESSWPTGPRTITLELEEDSWELLRNALEMRSSQFEQWKNSIERINDPDQMKNQLPWYSESLTRLLDIQKQVEDQIDRDFFSKQRAAMAARQQKGVAA